MGVWKTAGLVMLIISYPSQARPESLDFSSAGARVKYEAMLNPSHYTIENSPSMLRLLIECTGKDDNADFDLEHDDPKYFKFKAGKCVADKPFSKGLPCWDSHYAASLCGP